MRKMTPGIILLALTLFEYNSVYAQHKEKNVSHGTETIKKTDSLFTATLGEVPSGQSLPASFAKGLLNKPLIVHDGQHKAFPVVSFSFGYQTYSSYDNDTTGLPEKTSNYITFPFASNRLDSLWRVRIGNSLKSGDQLYFDHIIVEDTNGHYHLASPLHFTIK